MIFTLTTEQQLLADSAERYVRENYEFENWFKRAAEGQTFSRDRWRAMAEMGWLMVDVPEEAGGLGGTIIDAMVLMESFGRGLVLEPYVSTCGLGEPLLRKGNAALAADLVPALIQGELILAVAHQEPRSRANFGYVETRATVDGDGFVLSGTKVGVVDAHIADYIIIPARTSEASGDKNGISLFLVPADSAGLSQEVMRGPDHVRSSTLKLDKVKVGADRMLGAPGQGYALLDEAIDRAIILRLAEALGVMENATQITLQYLKTREQFGTKIGQFQALQHRIVDMTIACEEARALIYAAAAQLYEAPEVRRRSVSAAKARVGQNGMFVGHQAIQLHGGIGTTEELITSHYLKRLVMIEAAFGNSSHHLELFADQASS